jgi:hypothetical protein
MAENKTKLVGWLVGLFLAEKSWDCHRGSTGRNPPTKALGTLLIQNTVIIPSSTKLVLLFFEKEKI